MRDLVTDLYHGDSQRGRRFRFSLLIFDIVTILFFVSTTMIENNWVIYWIDFVIGGVLLLDFIARFALNNWRWQWLFHFHSIIDLIVICSLAAAFFIENMAFLRVVRMLRLLRSYRVMRDLQDQWRWFRVHSDVIESTVNLMIFVFVVAAIVYVAEHHVNPQINDYLDALYFTVTTLTTTGFGDITMQDTAGRFLSIMIMVVGVGLFLRLVQTIFRPVKVQYACPDCGLQRHESDAVHCKHCGRVLNIPSEGD